MDRRTMAVKDDYRRFSPDSGELVVSSALAFVLRESAEIEIDSTFVASDFKSVWLLGASMYSRVPSEDHEREEQDSPVSVKDRESLASSL